MLRQRNLALIVGVGLLLVVLATGCLQKAQKAPAPKTTSETSKVVSDARAGREPSLTLFDNKTGRKKQIKMEDYIAGVVAAEMEPSWPVEALAAQAILARTFTLEALESKGGTKSLHGTDVSTDVEEFQAYDPSRISDNVKKAVQATRGKVLTHEGKFVKGWFSAYAGPRTATAKEGLNFKEPEPTYIKSVSNPGAKNVPPKDKVWTATFSRSELEAAISKMGFPPGNGSTVTVTKRGPSGRAVKINVFGTDVPGADFRVALGSTCLKSILIDDIRVQGDQVTFQGRGFGHGVGMCQWGAYTMAKEGKKAEDIVHYFFKDVKVEKLYR